MSYEKCGILGCRRKWVCYTIGQIGGIDTVIKMCDLHTSEHKATKDLIESKKLMEKMIR